MSTITRGEKMQALRRARMAASPPFLRGAFRPFFLGAAIWAVIALGVWMTALTHGTTLPTAFDPLTWHRHEMLFGFVGAVIVGFLLTAIPNWTGRLPIAGPPLLSLFLLWIAGRVGVLFSGIIGTLAAAVLDVAFPVVLAFVAGREVLAAKNRNLPVVLLLLFFGCASAVDHAEAKGLIAANGYGIRAGIALVVVMIALIGGRIIPSFTRNWMSKQGIKEGLPGQPGTFDQAAIALTGLALVAWVVAPDGLAGAWLLIAAGAFQAARLARWRGWKTGSDPLVVILHIGYAWVPLGLALLGLSILRQVPSVSIAVHALTAGGMATMILAVMTRSSLGHTGRPLRASTATTLMYILVTLGAILRVGAPLLPVESMVGLELAALLWAAAFVVFTVVYGRILLASRLDDPNS